MLGAVPDRPDVRVRGAQFVVDEDAAVHGQARLPGQAHPRKDTAGQHHEVGVEGVTVGHLHGTDRARPGAHTADPGLGVHLDTQGGEVTAHQCRGARVELAFHQPLRLLGEDHPGTAGGEGAGGGDPEQPAADDHGPHPLAYRPGEPEAVVHGAEGVDASGSSVRPGASRPRRGGSTGLDPVARTSVPYAITEPSEQWSSRPTRSIRVTRAHIRRSGAGREITSGG